MSDLREAAEMAIETFLDPKSRADQVADAVKALRQALAQEEKPPVKSYCGGKPNYCTLVDAVNMSQERVDETAKGKHEPFIYIREDTEMPFGGFEHCGEHDPGAFPVYLAPPKREWVGLTDEERKQVVYTYMRDPFDCLHMLEAKLKEKNT